eukprot:423614-Prymnesium_polylepis.1
MCSGVTVAEPEASLFRMVKHTENMVCVCESRVGAIKFAVCTAEAHRSVRGWDSLRAPGRDRGSREEK